MVAELCEFYHELEGNDARCLLVKNDCTCNGDTYICTYPTELRKFNNACSDDWQADADHENRGYRQ